MEKSKEILYVKALQHADHAIINLSDAMGELKYIRLDENAMVAFNEKLEAATKEIYKYNAVKELIIKHSL
jgi:hypothetical protein